MRKNTKQNYDLINTKEVVSQIDNKMEKSDDLCNIYNYLIKLWTPCFLKIYQLELRNWYNNNQH